MCDVAFVGIAYRQSQNALVTALEQEAKRIITILLTVITILPDSYHNTTDSHHNTTWQLSQYYWQLSQYHLTVITILLTAITILLTAITILLTVITILPDSYHNILHYYTLLHVLTDKYLYNTSFSCTSEVKSKYLWLILQDAVECSFFLYHKCVDGNFTYVHVYNYSNR